MDLKIDSNTFPKRINLTNENRQLKSQNDRGARQRFNNSPDLVKRIVVAKEEYMGIVMNERVSRGNGWAWRYLVLTHTIDAWVAH